MTAPVCPYCGCPAELVSGEQVYPHRPDLSPLSFWRCAPCAAWVGCHRGTTRPLGRLANAELRAAKQAAHAAFDPIWQQGTTRSEAYAWLAGALGVPPAECHIGEFDLETCRRVVAVCASRRESERGGAAPDEGKRARLLEMARKAGPLPTSALASGEPAQDSARDRERRFEADGVPPPLSVPADPFDALARRVEARLSSLQQARARKSR